MWCSAGHQVAMPSVKTNNACSIGASTTIDDCTDVSAICVFIAPPRLPAPRLVDGRERPIPEPVEVGAQRIDSVRVQLVEPPGAALAVDHQAGLLEHLEVLGDSRPGDRELPGNLPYRPRTIRQQLEDRPSGRIAQRVHSVPSVSSH
jgi:hypothetical protein